MRKGLETKNEGFLIKSDLSFPFKIWEKGGEKVKQRNIDAFTFICQNHLRLKFSYFILLI